jgi:hypothetical protein
VKRGTVSLLKVKTCDALLHMLVVCVRIYIKSFLRYKFLILGTYYPETMQVHKQGCKDPWLFFEAKRCSRAKKLGKHCNRYTE